MEQNEKEKCPKCGSTKIAVVEFTAEGKNLFQVICSDCSLRGQYAETEEVALANWNKLKTAN